MSLSQNADATDVVDSDARPSAPPGDKLRICHIAATTEGGIWVYEQLRDLRDRFGHDVSVILNGDAGTLVDRFKAAGIPVLVADFEYLSSSDLFALPKKILRLASLLRRERFDIVQTHLFHSMVIGRFAAWLADVPVRLSMVAGPFHLEAYTSKWIDGSTQWMETALIPSCEFTRSIYKSMGVEEDRLKLIYYGPDETKFDPDGHQAVPIREQYGWPDDTPLIGMVAYFYAELGANRWTPPIAHGRSIKCQADLINAMPAILARVPNAKLVFVGSGWGEPGQQHLSNMKNLVRELGLDDSIKFFGYSSDIPGILKSLDVTVQASLSENLGGTIEALLMECPIVATRVGGLVDSVVDGKTGVVVNPSDPPDLARGILELLTDREKAKLLAANGRRLMEDRFTLRTTVEKEDALYRSLKAKAAGGYRLHVSALRGIIGGFVCAYLAGRYWLFDLRLLPALDAGWRPWHFHRTRSRIAGALRRLQGRSTHAASTYQPDARTDPVSGGPIVSPMRMALYRFYAWVGRRKLGWGIRKRIKDLFRQ
ncbi:Glycosyltransferase involved in cell wall bisynthesis [Devosia enhydra]|uniref:Glycosyltransferase involved in cell wall bisynthesis n=1 Tax=Devosia enhydra TaxID=665118 RepID=A0A1K2HSQ5_9HYPH|nr:glycosyltransferase family 4 protein [Devosia enhydra]SFZ80763.1 Glycosyltransferase involved in cell wall bisynthesis [Devosia enhydra]